MSALASACAGSQLSGVTYVKGKAGINRALLACSNNVTQSVLEDALKTPALASVHELALNTVSAVAAKDLPAVPSAPAGAAPAADAPAGGDAEAAGGPTRLDLATLYTSRGLFRGTARMPIPSNLDGQLYVPAGAAGVAMANLAARMGVETTGITLPLATPATGAAVRDVRTKSVVEASSDLGKEAERRFLEEDTAAKSAPSLSNGEGELHIVDKAFGRQPGVLVRGDEAGATVALHMLEEPFPESLGDLGKEHATLEEIRYDLHRFFSLRSSAGQAAFALYRLDRWAGEVKKTGTPRDVELKVYVDVAEPASAELAAQRQAETQLGATGVKVDVRSLHAGTQCCDIAAGAPLSGA